MNLLDHIIYPLDCLEMTYPPSDHYPILAKAEQYEICWSSMFNVMDVLCSRYEEILITLLKRAEDTDDPAITCGGMYHKLARGKMILTCVILKRSLAITTNLSDILQSTHLEWTNAAQEIELCKKMISQLTSDESLSSLIDEATSISVKCSIPLNITSPVYSLRSHFNITEINANSFTKEFVKKVSEIITAEILLRFF